MPNVLQQETLAEQDDVDRARPPAALATPCGLAGRWCVIPSMQPDRPRPLAESAHYRRLSVCRPPRTLPLKRMHPSGETRRRPSRRASPCRQVPAQAWAGPGAAVASLGVLTGRVWQERQAVREGNESPTAARRPSHRSRWPPLPRHVTRHVGDARPPLCPCVCLCACLCARMRCACVCVSCASLHGCDRWSAY